MIIERIPCSGKSGWETVALANEALILIHEGIKRCFTHFVGGRGGSSTYCKVYQTFVSTNTWSVCIEGWMRIKVRLRGLIY